MFLCHTATPPGSHGMVIDYEGCVQSNAVLDMFRRTIVGQEQRNEDQDGTDIEVEEWFVPDHNFLVLLLFYFEPAKHVKTR